MVVAIETEHNSWCKQICLIQLLDETVYFVAASLQTSRAASYLHRNICIQKLKYFDLIQQQDRISHNALSERQVSTFPLHKFRSQRMLCTLFFCCAHKQPTHHCTCMWLSGHLSRISDVVYVSEEKDIGLSLWQFETLVWRPVLSDEVGEQLNTPLFLYTHTYKCVAANTWHSQSEGPEGNWGLPASSTCAPLILRAEAGMTRETTGLE